MLGSSIVAGSLSSAWLLILQTELTSASKLLSVKSVKIVPWRGEAKWSQPENLSYPTLTVDQGPLALSAYVLTKELWVHGSEKRPQGIARFVICCPVTLIVLLLFWYNYFLVLKISKL